MDSWIKTILSQQMSGAEIAAVLTGLVCVWLLVRNSIGNWAWGIVNAALYGYVFYQQKLYANAWLNILYFLPMQFYGWWVWLRTGPQKQDDLPVTLLSNGRRGAWVGATLLLWVPISFYLRFTGDPNPYADGVTTAMSIVAQYLSAKKVLENWVLWIAADIIYVFYLFPTNKLYLSTGLYVAYLYLAVMGILAWQKIMRLEQATLESS